MSYAQNGEDLRVLEYFGDFIGTFLDLGAFSGIELSNTRMLAEKGWVGVAVEAALSPYYKLQANCMGFDIDVYNVAVGTKTGMVKFYDNANAVGTLHKEETERWADSQSYDEISVWCYEINEFISRTYHKIYDFISIDIEGEDIAVLQQMDLTSLGCRCLCIEHNGNRERIQTIINHCSPHGLKEIHRNGENIILAK